MNRDELLAAFSRTTDPVIVASVRDDDDGRHIKFRRPDNDRCAGGGTLFVARALLDS